MKKRYLKWLCCILTLTVLAGCGAEGMESSGETEILYRSGVYTCGVSLNDSILSLEIIINKDGIGSMRFIDMEESTVTMYPLMEPALKELEEQLMDGVSPEDIELSEEVKYTQLLLMEVIQQTLEKAKLE